MNLLLTALLAVPLRSPAFSILDRSPAFSETRHIRPRNMQGASNTAWMPACRTGGGFALTQRSPRPRAAHDQLPPPAAPSAPPKFLEQLLEKRNACYDSRGSGGSAGDGGGGSDGGISGSGRGGGVGNRAAGFRGQKKPPAELPVLRNLELTIPQSSANSTLHARFEGRNFTAPSQLPGGARHSPRTSGGQQHGFSTNGARPAIRAAAVDGVVPPATQVVVEVQRQALPSAPNASRQTPPLPDSPTHLQHSTPGSPCCGLQHWGSGDEPKRGLQGCTPRHLRDSRSGGASPGPSAHGGLSAAHEMDAFAPSKVKEEVARIDGVGINGGEARFVSGGEAASRGAAACGGGAAAGRRGACESGAACSGVPPAAVSCVPFPSMRHAHHLASVTRSSAGPRYPPSAPVSRDESAINRVSNYSIRPCIHDAQLSQRFGREERVMAHGSEPLLLLRGTHAASKLVNGDLKGPAVKGS